jgi:hypothetical protein
MNISEWLLIFATLAGPVVAVQTQKWIERATESRRRRRWIFDVMMSNRATRLADEHVRALNSIDLEFRRRRHFSSGKDQAVLDAWRSLFGELTRGIKDGETDAGVIAAWNRRCEDLYVVLLRAMSKAIGFSFTDEELRRGVYYPRGHGEREEAQLAILRNLRLLLEGNSSLNMKITEIPTSPDLVKAQTALLEKQAGAYTDDGSLRVVMETQKANGSNQ